MGTPPRQHGADAALFSPPSTQEFDEALGALLELIDAHQRFVVVSHIHPDGDAVGSTLAMGLWLEEMGKQVVFYNRDPVPYNFGFLPGVERWVHEIPEDFQAEVTILLDCAEPARAGEEAPAGVWAERVAVVDHHKTWDANFAQVYVRDVAAAATGEIIYRALVASGSGLSLDVARCLYCCLMTDTGSFRYSCTSKTTLQIAGELLGAGVDAWEMTSHIYESQPLERLELLARVLSTLCVSPDGKLAFITLDRDTLAAFDAGLDLTDGFINYGRSVRGVEVATQLLEIDENVWKISFRSRGAVDVSALAARFGGGGHHNAAGCVMQGPPGEVERELTAALEALLKAPGA